jgi:hypothetical protein
MDRLREFSIVTISLPDSARVSEFKAYVIGVHRRVATLQPVERVDALWLPETVADVLMSYVHGDQTVGLKGELKRGSQPDDLRFRVTDGVYLPRRRSSRLKLCAPASVTPLEGGREIVCQTQDVGADGVLLEGAAGLQRDQMLTLSVTLPENPEAVCAQAIVTDVLGDSVTALEFVGLERGTRRVLSDFVTEHFRRRLNIVRSLREEDDDDWD